MTSTTAMLRNAGRHPALPVNLALADGKPLEVQQWLRILPGKRLVGRGEWEGQQVLVKLFIATGAERHWQRESVGIQALQRASIRTPALLCSGELAGGGRYLLTEYLADAQSLQQCWDQLEDQAPGSAEAASILGSALATIGAMHVKGLAQTDLHLGNFLQDAQGVYVIDGDAIEAKDPGRPLPQSQAQANLALFFAQLMPQWDSRVAELLEFYLDKHPISGLTYSSLMAEVKVQRQKRLDNFLSKTLRDCSQFAVKKSFKRFCVVLRSEQELLAPLLNDPDSAFGCAPLLKDGGSSTVARIDLGGRQLVIKRYNIKGVGHWLKRFWRPSRAWHSWLAGWRLLFLGIATPKPLAMIERRLGPCRRQAWLITEYCTGTNLLQHWGEAGSKAPEGQETERLLQPFQQLTAARISHGDFKATNLLWHEDGVLLIDLDAMQAHSEEKSWQKAWKRDRARFIRNWPSGSPLRTWLQSRMPE